MSDTYRPGDRVRDAKWGGRFVGVVKRIHADGAVSVRWDGSLSEDQLAPYEMQPEEDPR